MEESSKPTTANRPYGHNISRPTLTPFTVAATHVQHLLFVWLTGRFGVGLIE
jgi:hypothetical protein